MLVECRHGIEAARRPQTVVLAVVSDMGRVRRREAVYCKGPNGLAEAIEGDLGTVDNDQLEIN